MEPVVCLDCGNILGAYYEAFSYMREILLTSKSTQEVHVDKKFIDPEANDNLIPIFEALQIHKYCCRGQLTSSLNMHDLEL
jgi:DNA-directed RNA polymerase subunit N (RpoN/RPB10)